MRLVCSLLLGSVLLGSGLSCGIPHETYQAQLAANRVLKAQLEVERERRAALEAQLITLAAHLDLLRDERDGLALSLEAEDQLFAESVAIRERLELLNAQLSLRERELTRLTELSRQNERASGSWYNAALERARRATQAPAGAP